MITDTDMKRKPQIKQTKQIDSDFPLVSVDNTQQKEKKTQIKQMKLIDSDFSLVSVDNTA